MLRYLNLFSFYLSFSISVVALKSCSVRHTLFYCDIHFLYFSLLQMFSILEFLFILIEFSVTSFILHITMKNNCEYFRIIFSNFISDFLVEISDDIKIYLV